MKIFKKITAGLLALIMMVALMPVYVIPTQAEGAEGNALRLWYDKPASQGTNILGAGANYSDADGSNTWQQQTLPIGNGDMGANVYGEIVNEHLTFNEKTLWTGGPSASRPDYKGGNLENNGQNGAIMARVQELFLAGQTQQAVNLCNQLVGAQAGYGAYQPWGDIWFDYTGISTNVTDYQRDLDLNTGIASVSFTENGTEYTREYFISHDDNVLVARLEAKGSAKLNLGVRFTSKQNGTTVVSGNNTLVLNGQVSDNQLKYASYLTVVPEGGSVTGSGSQLTVSGADAITVYVSAATDYKNTFWNEDGTDDYYYRTGETDAELAARVSADVSKAVANGYAAVKASHLADYQEMFDRVELDLGQTVSEKTTDQLLAAYKNGSASAAEKRQLEVILFQYGRYLTIASSREDSQLPSNLQGVWNVLNNPPWASDYHMNVNLQMNYWPTYSTNLAECALPLIDYIDSLREPGRITAKIYNGADVGFSAHTQNTPFGWTCPGWSFSWGWSPAAVPWILQNCWEYYEYTGDVEFMRDYIYPMLKEEAQFYDEILIEDNDGKLVSAPAYSPEHGPYTLGNTYEQSLVWQLYEDVVIAAQTLGVDEDLIAKWKSNQANLKGPIEIGTDGQLKEWYEETTLDSMKSQGADPAGHRHLSHMLGLFPGDLVQRNPEWIAAAKVYMDYRTDNSTGWGMGQRINTWARLGEGNKALELIGNLFKGGIYPNLWDAHTPFQIDGNFGMTSGVAEMLMQSNMGFINLLPALPDDWAQGSVDGLVARGNFEISMDWVKGGITNATIESKNGGVATILADNIGLATVTDSNGNAVDFTVTADGKISFNTVEGETYTLSIPERPAAPTNLVVVRESATTASLSWDAVSAVTRAVDGVTYNVYRQSETAEYVQLASGLTETSYIDNAVDAEAAYLNYAVTASVNGIESTLSASARMNAPASEGMVDNVDARIAYEGGWANWTENVNYNGTIMYLQGDAYSTDATVTMDFIGTGIEVITCTNYDRSFMEVFIDGVSCGKVDTYSASTVRQKKIFTKDDLEYGLHTIVLKPLQEKHASSGGYKLELDAFNVLDDRIIPGEPINLEVGESYTVTVDGDLSGEYSNEFVTVSTAVESEATGSTTSGNFVTPAMGLEDGRYLIVSANQLYKNSATYALLNKVTSGSNLQFSNGMTVTSFDDTAVWNLAISNTADNGYLTATLTNGDGDYLTNSGAVKVVDTAATVTIEVGGDNKGGSSTAALQDNAWRVNLGGGQYLNWTSGGAATWSDKGDDGNHWYFYKVIDQVESTTTITFTGAAAGETTVQIGDEIYTFIVTEPVIDPADASRDIPLDVLEVSAGNCEQNGLQYNEGPAEFAVDENPNSLWHTDWYGESRDDHWFQFELTEGYTVDGLRYWPRQAGNTNGTITEYEIQVSNDGENFETVASGNWEGDRNWKIAKFEGQNVRYVRLVAVNALTDNEYVFASASEIRLTGVKGGELPHQHSWSDWNVTTEPTCTNEGVETRSCACGESETRAVDALGHNPGETVRENEVAPTCTTEGSYDLVVKCTVCSEELSRESFTVDALGHTPGEAVRENWVIGGCTKDSSYESVVCCEECGEELSRETVIVPAPGHNWEDGRCTECGERQDEPVVNPFIDVKEGDYFYDAVMWAIEEGVTSGTSDTTFSPYEVGNRAAAITMLWRAVGRPEPETEVNPFKDVKETDYFYKAVLWGVEEGVVAGVSADRFAPYMECTRAHVIAFLYRYRGSPDVSEYENPFVDVVGDEWYASAVVWAAEMGIAAGITPSTFAPNAVCNRAQIVTFLYRWFGDML